MSAVRTLGGLVGVGVAALVIVQVGKGDPGDPPVRYVGGEVPVRIVATWGTVRDFQMSWTANGQKSPNIVSSRSPWARDITALPGSVVTFTVRPLIGGPGNHTCRIEQPPGTPRGGHAQQTGGGNTPIMCTHTVGS